MLPLKPSSLVLVLGSVFLAAVLSTDFVIALATPETAGSFPVRWFHALRYGWPCGVVLTSIVWLRLRMK